MGRVFERVNRSVPGRRGSTVDERGSVSMRHESSVESVFWKNPLWRYTKRVVHNRRWSRECRVDPAVKGPTKLIGARCPDRDKVPFIYSSSVYTYLQAAICSWNDW